MGAFFFNQNHVIKQRLISYSTGVIEDVSAHRHISRCLQGTKESEFRTLIARHQVVKAVVRAKDRSIWPKGVGGACSCVPRGNLHVALSGGAYLVCSGSTIQPLQVCLDIESLQVPVVGPWDARCCCWQYSMRVSSETVQSGKFYRIRETLSVQNRSNLGNFIEYGKRYQFQKRSNLGNFIE